ncbi:MAG: restriction endonuclease subunit S, partial [Candidatus Jacksonbacteria bacterium]
MISCSTKKLGEICDFQNGLWKGKKPPFKKVAVLRNTNFRNGGYLDLSNVAEIKVEKKQLINRLLQKGDLILERSGGGPTQPVGRVVYFNADREFSFSNFTTRIRIKNPKKNDSEYLWRYLNHLYISGVTEI